MPDPTTANPFDTQPTSPDGPEVNRLTTPDGEIIELPANIHKDNAGQIAAQAIEVYIKARNRKKATTRGWKSIMSTARDVITHCFGILDTDRLQSDAGYAYVQADGESISYDSDALDRLCLENPAMREILWPHRTVRQRRGGVRVRAT